MKIFGKPRVVREERNKPAAEPGPPEAEPREKPQLTEEKREQLIEEARSKLPELDRTVEKSLSQLRELSKS